MRYFGYGSNLHRADLEAWSARRGHDVRGVRALGPAWLPDHEVVFHYLSRARGGGALSVRARPGAVVPGVLFEVDAPGWHALDAKEGAPRTYARVDLPVLLSSGDEAVARTYVVADAFRREAHVPPHETYLALVCEALLAFGLPDAHVRAAAHSLEAPSLARAVFAYGTLRRGERRHGLVLAHRPRVVEGSIAGRIVDLGEYPGLVGCDGGRVRGEILVFDDPAAALASLDEVEGFLGYGRPRSLYRRVLVEARGDDGDTVPAWTYRYLGSMERARPIESGDWLAR